MFRASRCRQRPSVVRAGRLGLLPKLRRWVWGLGWSNCGPVPAQATWATMQVCDSERCQQSVSTPSLRHALHCVASTGIAAELGENVLRSRVERSM
jgi:hypothetical protein